MTLAEINALIAKYGRHFSAADFGKDASQMDPAHLEAFLRFRRWHGHPSLVTSSVRPGDAGAHGKGLANDVILFAPGRYLEEVLPADQLWTVATTWPWAGVGLYTDWKCTFKSGKVGYAAGIHVDSWHNSVKRPLRWVRHDGRYYYQDLVTGYFHASSGHSFNLEHFLDIIDQRRHDPRK